MRAHFVVIIVITVVFLFTATRCTTTATYTGPHTLEGFASDMKPAKGKIDNASSPAGGMENVVFLNDGSEIRGEIVNQNRTSITVKTKFATMTIEKKNIKEIKYK